MEQLHSLSALDDEGLLTRLGRRVSLLHHSPLCGTLCSTLVSYSMYFLSPYVCMYVCMYACMYVDGGVPAGASAVQDAHPVSPFGLQ